LYLCYSKALCRYTVKLSRRIFTDTASEELFGIEFVPCLLLNKKVVKDLSKNTRASTLTTEIPLRESNKM